MTDNSSRRQWADHWERTKARREHFRAEAQRMTEIARHRTFVERHPRLVGTMLRNRYGPDVRWNTHIGITICRGNRFLACGLTLQEAIALADQRAAE